MYQKLTIAGNLGRDPEMRYLPNGTAVTNLNVATNRVYTKDGQKVTETSWFRVTLWGATGENANAYLKKGRQVLIEGYLNSDPETGGPRVFTRNDGTAGANYEMTCDRIVYLGGRGETIEDTNTPEDEVPF